MRTPSADALLDNAPDAIIVVGVSASIVFVNAEADRAFGYERGDLVGRPIDELLPGASSDVDLRRRNHVALGPLHRAPARSEQVGRRHDGSEFPAEVSWSVIDSDPDPFVTAAVRDATGRKRGGPNPYVMLESSPDAIVAVAADGRIALVNAQAERLFGYEHGELIGLSVETLVPEQLRAIHRHLRDGYWQHQVTRQMGGVRELAGRRKGGSEFPAEIALTSIEVPEGTLIAAAVRDGSDRKQAAIISSSNDAIISQSLEGTITSWNPSAERLFGYHARDVLGRNGNILLPREQQDEQVAVLARVALGEATLEHDAVRVRSDGTSVDVATTVSPILDGAGVVVGASVIARDITDRTRAADERRALQEQLNQSQRLESLGQLAGGVAHDFNNLLAVIISYATLVAEAVEENEPVHADVVEIRIAAERAAALTHRLLLFGRREAVRPSTIDLNAVVADVHTLLSRTLGEQVELIVHAAPELPMVRADLGQLEQVLVNLAVNARDAMPEGGTLTIETGVAEMNETSTLIRADIRAGRYVMLAVTDSGEGMASDVLAQAFDPFFTTKPHDEGSGLGLATVYGIATEAGGTVMLDSQVGVGTTACVYLPAVDQLARAGGKAPMANIPQGRGETILVVEDEPAVLAVTRRLLARNGYEVLDAPTGEEALTIIGERGCDLLLTDVVMPQMSGLDLAEHVHEHDPGLPVLFMSGYSQGVLDPQRVLDEHVALIQKPFSEESLLQKVRCVLDAATTRARSQ